MPRVVVTGGPGVGKTTLLAELSASGYATVSESARAITPWEGIYTTDSERDHSFSWVERVHSQLLQWYRSCGYVLHEVPRLPVAERAKYVLRALAHGTA